MVWAGHHTELPTLVLPLLYMRVMWGTGDFDWWVYYGKPCWRDIFTKWSEDLFDIIKVGQIPWKNHEARVRLFWSKRLKEKVKKKKKVTSTITKFSPLSAVPMGVTRAEDRVCILFVVWHGHCSSMFILYSSRFETSNQGVPKFGSQMGYRTRWWLWKLQMLATSPPG